MSYRMLPSLAGLVFVVVLTSSVDVEGDGDLQDVASSACGVAGFLDGGCYDGGVSDLGYTGPTCLFTAGGPGPGSLDEALVSRRVFWGLTTPSGFILPEKLPGQNGVPRIVWGNTGLNEIGTAGPFVQTSVNGIGANRSVFLGNGASYVHRNDFYLPLNGIDWFLERTYSSENPSSLTWMGENWWITEMMNITVDDVDGASDVAVQMDPHHTLNFTYSGGSWTCDDAFLYDLTFSSGSDEYTVQRIDGFAYVFHDKNVTGVASRLKRIEDPHGTKWTLNYDFDPVELGWVLDYIDVDVIVGADHRIRYEYYIEVTDAFNVGKLRFVKIFKTTTETNAHLIGKIEYVYHDNTADAYGTQGDLMKATVQHKATADADGVLSIEEKFYYRYFESPWGTGRGNTPGIDHQLRYVLNPENADRLNTDKGNPETQTNTDFEDYANVIYEYENGSGRVTKTQERLSGISCGCGGAGGTPATTTYTWTENTGSPDLDTWKFHCVADRQDDTRVIFDVNRWYQPLTWVVQDEDDGTPNRELIWHCDYGTTGPSENRLTTLYQSSAMSDYNESTYAVTFKSPDAGVVYKIDYDYTTNTYDGYPEKIRIKNGDGGTKQTLRAYGRSITERPDLPTTITEFEEEDEGNARVTTMDYTFYDDGGDKVQIKQLDVTYPAVSTAKNGPGTSAVRKQFYDKRTRAMRWQIDPEGFVLFYAFDTETGFQTFAVRDVKTSTLSSDITSRWDGINDGGFASATDIPFTRTGGGTELELTDSAVYDWLGRYRKRIDREGKITYTVYKDDESRVYPAWNTTTKKAQLPIRVTKTDKEGRPEDVLTLNTDKTPTVDGSNEPTGAETYGNSDMATRTLNSYNIAGMREHSDRYHDFPATGDGTRYTHFYRMAFEYDGMGRREYTIQDVADESPQDREQVTQVFYDLLGRRIKTAEAVSDETHNIGTGKPTMTTTGEFFYDDPDSDSTPEQGEGDGVLSWTRRWFDTGASDYNDTGHKFDWRNRRSVTSPPLAPYTLVAYDHLDRVIEIGTYDTDEALDALDMPSTTDATNRLDLSKTFYDEHGQVYKSEVFDDPADTTPADALVTNTYRDRRGLVWAVDAANTGIRFTEYDGAGRRTKTMSGTKFDPAGKYASSVPDYPDDDEGFVQQTELTLDDVGNVTKRIGKELNHDDTNGMNATTPDFVRTYSYSWYDAAHRLVDSANYGTNNSSGWKDNATAPTYGASAPTRSDTVLVTTYTYDNEGDRDSVTDPRGIVTKSMFDQLGRTIAKIEDEGCPGGTCSGGTCSGGHSDGESCVASALDRMTEYQYNAAGSLVRIMHDPATDNTYANGTWTTVGGDKDQVTEYGYTDGQSAGRVTEIRYPTGDGTVGSTQADKVVFTYNVDGTLKDRTDQNGTKNTFSYDTLRRKSEEEVTTLGTYTGGSGAVDGAIRAYTWEYDDEGRVIKRTAVSDTTPDPLYTDATSQIVYTYNAADKLTKVEQEEDGKVVGGTTLAVEYGYDADYDAADNYNRKDWIKYPDGRKIWNVYSHTGAASTLQDEINEEFNRVGQIARDNSGAAGDILAEYDFNGMGRFVRRDHDEDTGAYGNDTRVDLWHGTPGHYKGFDRFGRIVRLKHADWSGVEFLDRKYGLDRLGNRTSIGHLVRSIDSQTFGYDNLNRLTSMDRGYALAGVSVITSDVSLDYDMDLLGNFSSGDGIQVNGTASTIKDIVNWTNEITTADRPNPSGAPAVINEPFVDGISALWTEQIDDWVVLGGVLMASGLTGGEAVILAAPRIDAIHHALDIKFASGSSTNKAGLIFGHDGNNSYHAVVLDRAAGKIALYSVASGSWGTALATATATISDDTTYTIKVNIFRSGIDAGVVGQSLAVIGKSLTTPTQAGQSGVYTDTINVTFDNFIAHDIKVRDPMTPRVGGSADTSLVSGKLQVAADPVAHRGGMAVVEGFSDDYYVVEADLQAHSGRKICVRYRDPQNAICVEEPGNDSIEIRRYLNGQVSVLEAGDDSPGAVTVRVRVFDDSGTDTIKVYVDGVLKVTATDSQIPFGGVAFGGTGSGMLGFDTVRIGYDNNGDGDIADGGDDIIWDEEFGGTICTVKHDDAGNLIDDCEFVYIYDAWNRLVKVRASHDSDVTIQTAEFDATGRRIKKVVTKSGGFDDTVVYFYDGQKICETRNGSGNMVQQFIHGTQYIDELVMVRVAKKGDLYVHQDANWNVIGLTDLAGSVIERHKYTPYGIMQVDQETGFGDRDGDGDVDATDKGTPGTDCTGTVTGACRVNDLDFDGDYDSADATLFDALPQGEMLHPGRIATSVDQHFGHQGLLFEPEIGSAHNRARQKGERQFFQRDRVDVERLALSDHHIDALNLYTYERSAPQGNLDPSGWDCCFCCSGSAATATPPANPITAPTCYFQVRGTLTGCGSVGNCICDKGSGCGLEDDWGAGPCQNCWRCQWTLAFFAYQWTLRQWVTTCT